MPSISFNSKGEASVSLYSGSPATLDEVRQQVRRLRVAFPDMTSNEFFVVLTEQVVLSGMTPDRLRDAVAHVLRTFRYRRFNIADVLDFDRVTRLYTYREVVGMVQRGEAAWPDFTVREIDGEFYRVRKADMIA